MKSLVMILIWCFMIFCPIGLAGTTICRNARTCESRGLDAMHNKDLAAAQNFFEDAVGYAEDADNKLESVEAYNNLTLMFIKTHDYENALRWVQTTLSIDPSNKLATGYSKRITASYLISGVEASGTYVKYAGRNYWNQLKVSEKTPKGYKFDLTLYRIGPAWRKFGPSQVGEVHGLLVRVGKDEFVYKGDEDFSSCRIHFRFIQDNVVLSQDDDCGFGYGLQADGTLRRITK